MSAAYGSYVALFVSLTRKSKKASLFVTGCVIEPPQNAVWEKSFALNCVTMPKLLLPPLRARKRGLFLVLLAVTIVPFARTTS